MKPAVALATLEVAKEDGGGRRLADERERRRLLTACDASGLTQRTFAKQEGINYFTFAGWLRKRRLEAGRAAESASAKMPAFVEVNLPRAGLAVEIVMPDGLIVRAGRLPARPHETTSRRCCQAFGSRLWPESSQPETMCVTVGDAVRADQRRTGRHSTGRIQLIKLTSGATLRTAVAPRWLASTARSAGTTPQTA